MGADPALYSFGPHPDLPGWSLWRVDDAERFNHVLGELAIQCREDGRVLLRLQPQQRLSNLVGGMHGGALMTFIDVALFVGPMARGDHGALGGATIDLSTQFAGAVDLSRPLDLILEIVRETGRLRFLRGTVEQGDAMIASFMGTVRKPR